MDSEKKYCKYCKNCIYSEYYKTDSELCKPIINEYTSVLVSRYKNDLNKNGDCIYYKPKIKIKQQLLQRILEYF